MTLVIDASVAAKWFFAEPASAAARALLDRSDTIIAPTLVLAEIGNAAWKRYRRGEINRAEAESVVKLAPGPFFELVPLEELFPAAAILMLDHAHPIYDCLYLALAAREQASIVTSDRKLAGIAERVGIRVEYLA